MYQKNSGFDANLLRKVCRRIGEKLKSKTPPILVFPPGGQIWDIHDLKKDSKSLEDAQKICDYDDLEKELEAVRNILQDTILRNNKLVKENEILKLTVEQYKTLNIGVGKL